MNIYPRQIEDVIARQPGVLEAAVVGKPDPEWGERLKAFVVMRAGAQSTEESIMECCRVALGSLKTPSSVIFTTELPRNAGGKVLKGELRGI